MKWTSLGFAAILVVAMIFAASLQAQISSPLIFEGYNFDFTGAGARAEGMGGAFLAVSDDISAGSWNPAGLHAIDKPVVGFTVNSLSPRGSSTSYPQYWYQERSVDHSGSFSSFSALNFAAPIRIKGHKVVGTFNYGQNSQEYYSIGFLSSPLMQFAIFRGIDWIEIITVETQLDVIAELQGGIAVWNLGFGTRVSEKLSFGATINIYSGNTTKEVVAEQYVYDIPYFQGQIISRRFNQVITDSSSFSGVNATLAFKYETERLVTGLTVRTPFSLKSSTNYSNVILGYFKGETGEWTVDGDVTDTTYFDNLVTKYQMPWMVGLGMALKQSEDLTLALDLEYRGFSGKEVQFRDSTQLDPSGSNTDYFTDVDPEWSNVLIVRTGVEYRKETGIGNIPLRAGFAYIPIPGPSIDATSFSLSTVNSQAFSLGTGIYWEQIKLDLAYTNRSWDRESVSGYVLQPVEIKQNNHHIGFSFTGVF